MRTINIDAFYKYVNWLAAKNVSGGNIPPDMFNIAVPICVNKVVRKYYGVPEQYQPQMPSPSISYEITQLVTDYISQLKKSVVLSVDDSGQASKPEDYLHKSSIGVSWTEVMPATDNPADGDCCNDIPTVQQTKKQASKKSIIISWIPVTVVTDAEQWGWRQSSLREPTKEYPICSFVGNDKIQFYPQDIKSAYFTYLRYPNTCKWGYTIDLDGFPVYDSATSVDIELPEICADEMAVTVLDRVGISIREAGLSQWAKFTKQSGM